MRKENKCGKVVSMNSYKTPAGPITARIVEKKSEFIANLSPAASEEEALVFLEKIRVAHRTATHNVYAYVLKEGSRQRYSDDGEPAKTAGLPVLGAITHANLTNCIIVVTRYFGGTLLGTGGLVRAYGGAASAAVEQAEILTVRSCITLTFTVDYALFEQVRRLLDESTARMSEPEFAEKVTIQATLPHGDEPPILQALEELTRGEVQIQISSPFFIPF